MSSKFVDTFFSMQSSSSKEYKLFISGLDLRPQFELDE